MQDTPLLSTVNENIDRNSHIEETDYEIRSKPTTAYTENDRVPSKLPPFRSVHKNNYMRPTHEKKKTISFEPPVSLREGWWRKTIKDTPNPGTYETHLNTFIKEIVARPATYGFKSDGRRRDPQPLEPKGRELLPGAYSVEDFVDRMNQLRLSYGFKGPDRENVIKQSITGNQDKNIDLAPGLYETQKYHSVDTAPESIRHSFFKSKTTREVFLPKIGPAPSDYEPKTTVVNVHSPTITSAFRSGTDRFRQKVSRAPGPGTYDKLINLPKEKQISAFAMRGTYYNANFAYNGSAF